MNGGTHNFLGISQKGGLKLTMNHFFNVDIATEYGVNAAVLLERIGYWVKQNEANDTNFFDGYYWTYNSRRAYRELFPYMSKRQLDTAFQKLIDAGLIITGNYNKQNYDRTLWYTLSKNGKAILHYVEIDCLKTGNALPQNVKSIVSKCEMDYPKTGNGLSQNVQPIPVNKPVNKPISKPVKNIGEKHKRFVPPTLDEVKDYCKQRKNSVDAQKFFDYFEASGWVDSKGNPVRNWKQKIITWEGSEQNGKYGTGGVSDGYSGQEISIPGITVL